MPPAKSGSAVGYGLSDDDIMRAIHLFAFDGTTNKQARIHRSLAHKRHAGKDYYSAEVSAIAMHGLCLYKALVTARNDEIPALKALKAQGFEE